MGRRRDGEGRGGARREGEEQENEGTRRGKRRSEGREEENAVKEEASGAGPVLLFRVFVNICRTSSVSPD